MAAAGRKRDIAIRVMVTAKEQAEIRKAANKAAMPMSVYVRAKALEAARAGDARGDLPTAFHEAGHVAAAWRHGLKVHSVTIVPTPEFRGHIWHANPLRGIHLDCDGSVRARIRAEVGIIVCLAGPEAQRRFSPRSWRCASWRGSTREGRRSGFEP